MANQSSFSWVNLIAGLFLIIASLIAFSDPAGSLFGLTVFLGVIAIIKGIFNIAFRRRFENIIGQKLTTLTVLGVLDIIFGLILLFNIQIGMLTIPLIFAIWFVIDSVFGLMTAKQVKVFGDGYYWFRIIMSIIGIIVGILLVCNPIASALTVAFLVGFYFMLAGIVYITEAFA